MGIIEEMYDNDIFNSYENNSKAYKTALKEVCEAEHELMEQFPECKELFGKYHSAEMELMGIDIRQEFIRGFRCGAQMMMEILMQEDTDEV